MLYIILLLLFFQFPTAISVVNHLPGHAAVDADVLARYKAGLVATKEQHHIGNVHGITHSAGRLLRGIRAFVDGVCRIYPPRGNGVHPCFSRQTDSQCVGQCSNATFGFRSVVGSCGRAKITINV